MARRLLYACACVVGAVMLVGTPALGQSTLALTPLKVVLLGDSYSAGNGAGDYYGPHECYRSKNNWAERYIEALRTQGYAVTFVNRACRGGVTADIFNDRVDDDGFLRTRLASMDNGRRTRLDSSSCSTTVATARRSIPMRRQ